jgi:hypothetical protein
MGRKMLLVAIGCGRLPGILDAASKHSFVVLGTMQGSALAGFAAFVSGGAGPAPPVYFYESG